jgi:DNA invertase Pin-like site-specific DNA recombinase
MSQITGAFVRFERALIRSRKREGIPAARAADKHLGRRAALTVEPEDPKRTVFTEGV